MEDAIVKIRQAGYGEDEILDQCGHDGHNSSPHKVPWCCRIVEQGVCPKIGHPNLMGIVMVWNSNHHFAKQSYNYI